MGVFSEADHGRTQGGYGGGKRQVGEHPHQSGGAGWSGWAVSGEVKVGPPCAESGQDRDEGDAEGQRVDRGVRESPGALGDRGCWCTVFEVAAGDALDGG